MTRTAMFYEAWSGSTGYLVGDVVTSSGVAYVCISAHTNHVPPNGTYWVSLGGAAVPAFATPAIVFGSSAAAGAAGTVIRSDGTIAAFDVTDPTTQAFGDAAVVGTAAFAARRDHKHGMPSIAYSGFTAGDYYMPTGGALSSTGLTLAVLYTTPFAVWVTKSFDLVGCEVTAFGAATAVARMGIYNDNGSGRPGALRIDFGTVATTTPNGNKEISISPSHQLTPGVYWLALATQTITCSMRCLNAAVPPINVGSLAAPGNTHSVAYFKNSVTGALSGADPYGTPSGMAGVCPRVYLRAV